MGRGQAAQRKPPTPGRRPAGEGPTQAYHSNDNDNDNNDNTTTTTTTTTTTNIKHTNNNNNTNNNYIILCYSMLYYSIV